LAAGAARARRAGLGVSLSQQRKQNHVPDRWAVGQEHHQAINPDTLTAGWWEAPDKTTKEPWKFHPAPFGQPAAQMYVFDFDGDGDQDVLSSSAHRTGIWWHEQTGKDEWKTHEIDASIAQTHALVLADMNGDGLPDFVTGKRFYAHNGNDPGEDQPATLFWYELSRENGKPKWTPHQIDHDSGVGTQFEVTDMNRDGLLDVIISNKKGVFYFVQFF